MKNQKLIEKFHEWRKTKYPAWAELGFTVPEALMIHYLGNIDQGIEEVNDRLYTLMEFLEIPKDDN